MNHRMTLISQHLTIKFSKFHHSGTFNIIYVYQKIQERISHRFSRSFVAQSLVRRSPILLQKCRQYLRKLDSIPIRQHIVRQKANDSTEDTEIYFYSVKDILHCALSVTSLASKMYFGPAIKVETWHGILWCQSPLFGDNMVDAKGKSMHYEFVLQSFKCRLTFLSCRRTVQSW
jgi:hypothetical protein